MTNKPFVQPSPVPSDIYHGVESTRRRLAALKLSRGPVVGRTNGEMEAFAGTWPTNFTKGLDHDDHGVVDAKAYETFFHLISEPDYPDDTKVERVAPFAVEQSGQFKTADPSGAPWKLRGWESPIAGHQYDLQGPDAAAVAIAPAPRLGSDELAAEMAEVYAMAILRDHPLESIRANNVVANDIVAALSEMPWFKETGTPVDADGGPISPWSERRRRRDGGALSAQNLFRGSVPGCADGPYLSQFMLLGNGPLSGGAGVSSDGLIRFGAQQIDQRVEPQKAGEDYMRVWAEWLDVQNGANTRSAQAFEGAPRFIATLRDLATYVHFDALYQAYLNACLVLLGMEAAFDRGFPEPNGVGGQAGSRDPFATFGSPHILTLVTESATRSLKAVRRQKFMIHNRARPEAMGGIATLAANGEATRLGPAEAAAMAHLAKLEAAKTGDFNLVVAIEGLPVEPRFGAIKKQPAFEPKRNLLLPMAFPEGSPMHPAYGAGHATVAGSCVTLLKAFFEMYDQGGVAPLTLDKVGNRTITETYVASSNGDTLAPSQLAGDAPANLTLMGELNKLSANISIGRNMAGVHYYSDYFDSVRMGERVAVGMLLEQMTTYTEAVAMTFDSFDGDRVVIFGNGFGDASMTVNGTAHTEEWWLRHLPQGSGT